MTVKLKYICDCFNKVEQQVYENFGDFSWREDLSMNVARNTKKKESKINF